MKLTSDQMKAVKHVRGNVLVNSSAGSGKTAVFSSRIANLIANEGVAPESILGLTFTKDAAENMRKRLSSVIGKGKSDKVNLSTFHSFAYRILKSEYPREFSHIKITEMWWKLQTIYDIVGKKSYKTQDSLELDVKGGEMLAFISYQKANMIRPGYRVIIDDKVPFVKHIDRSTLQLVYDRYCEAVKHARTMDFDDMLLEVYYKLIDDKKLLHKIKSQYQYVLVDEFQDTNSINMEILKLITNNNLFVVGDFRQGVYGFINANIDNILTMRDTFDDVELIELRHNFRSTNNIVKICNDIIDVSDNEKYKGFSGAISAKNVDGEPVKVKVFSDEVTEFTHIVSEIETMIDSKPDLTYNDFCILCRTNAQLGVFESVLADRGIPARLSDSKSFFDRKEIADILAYASHAIDPSDDMSLRRIANSPTRFISRAILNKLDEYAYKNNKTLEESISYIDAGRASKNLEGIKQLFSQLRDHTDETAHRFLQKIIYSTGYMDFISQKGVSPSEIIIKEESIGRLLELSKKFTSIQAFLTHVQIIKNNSKKKDVAVNVMTVHSSKGLEFKHVFAAGVSEENYPHKMAIEKEEERRLLYVALSRAIETLTITTSLFGQSESETIKPSPFLSDIMEGDLKLATREVLRGSDLSHFYYKPYR